MDTEKWRQILKCMYESLCMEAICDKGCLHLSNADLLALEGPIANDESGRARAGKDGLTGAARTYC